jgi:FMN-dependent oxidoreductase (nitrilotriacetate monooxygenase family)
MRLAAFASASTTQGSWGSWTNPRTDPGILSPDYYMNLARSLERGGFDILFFDDRLAVPAVYGDSIHDAVERGSRALKFDLLAILNLVSAVTSRIGLGATYSTTYHAPYHVARAFATLDHLSGGRAVWNIVTSVNSDEAENFGVDYRDTEHRYDRADEFLDIVTGLWETWASDAVKIDRVRKVWADPDRVRRLNYEGKYLSSKGPLSVPQPPQGWPILLQAGQSGPGRAFSAKWADLAFTAQTNLDGAQTFYREQMEAVVEAGRAEDALRILPAAQVIVGETEEIALAKEKFADSFAEPGEELVTLAEMSNFDFATMEMDAPFDDTAFESMSGARFMVESHLKRTRTKHGDGATLRDLATDLAGQVPLRFVGSPQQIADRFEEWFQGRACDGFAVIPTDTPGSFEDFGRLVIPELRSRGLMPSEEEQGKHDVLRDRLGLPQRTSW